MKVINNKYTVPLKIMHIGQIFEWQSRQYLLTNEACSRSDAEGCSTIIAVQIDNGLLTRIRDDAFVTPLVGHCVIEGPALPNKEKGDCK